LFARWLRKAGTELLADADLIVPVPLYLRGAFKVDRAAEAASREGASSWSTM
jgi:predicted amidophosphoribosyltransferase